MVQLFSFLRSIQNLRQPSFFKTRTTVLAHGLCDFGIAPISSISWIWALMLSYMWGGIHQYSSSKGIQSITSILCLIRAVLLRSRSLILSITSILCLIRAVLLRSRSLHANWDSHFSSNTLACFCSALGHSLKPWRSRASKTHPFWGFGFDSSEVLVGWATSGTWLAGATCQTTVFAGISMV